MKKLNLVSFCVMMIAILMFVISGCTPGYYLRPLEHHGHDTNSSGNHNQDNNSDEKGKKNLDDPDDPDDSKNKGNKGHHYGNDKFDGQPGKGPGSAPGKKN